MNALTNNAVVSATEQAAATAAVKKAIPSHVKAARAPGKATVTKAQVEAAVNARRAAKGKPPVGVKAAKPVATEGEGVMGALAASLTVDQAEQAESAAIAAIRKAKKPAVAKGITVTGGKRPALSERYALGAYNGKAGAMFAFMARLGTLSDTFSRDDVCASCAAKAIDAKVSTRAQALDYFAWAARNGLIVVAADQSVPAAPVVKAVKAKAAKQSKKAAVKA